MRESYGTVKERKKNSWPLVHSHLSPFSLLYCPMTAWSLQYVRSLRRSLRWWGSEFMRFLIGSCKDSLPRARAAWRAWSGRVATLR